MDIYHIWCDLKEGQNDLEFTENVQKYLTQLESNGRIEGWRLTRRKLGLSPSHLGEFHILIETKDLAQLDTAFVAVSERTDPVEELHYGVNSMVKNFQAALYRDFPDSHRKRGDERF